ncbi:hypothetical protein DPMN_149095 [Dreissena polymorpha]|uniref:Uncharacterized protein n=1 Tax=Dreissena polymorpha TaxID=45954 RepID=A0A9D4FCZ5_DREPO|nr:hypothetical protein DPMN_149095 [Dreissena polymorpha]
MHTLLKSSQSALGKIIDVAKVSMDEMNAFVGNFLEKQERRKKQAYARAGEGKL